MNLRYDLHCHSTASDGTLTPSEVVVRACQQSVDVIALTDHDSTSGIKEAADQAMNMGISFVPGIELSVTWSHQTIHIVGLGIQHDNSLLLDGLKKLHRFRQSRGEEIARKLEKAGVVDALEGARKYANGEILSRTHFARYLIEAGKAKDIKQVFKRFLVRGKPGHVAGSWASLEEAIYWIHAAGGLAVIAHPARYGFSATRLRQLMGEFAELGGVGFEAISGSHSPDEELRMAALANKFDLYISMGSDYHGPENPYRELGALSEVPFDSKPIWQSERWLQCLGHISGVTA